ncbi:hypothetical protein [Vibrio hyugaensis]|nr:hypothetical protein [Vibrio hyugaensis]
MLQEGKRWEHLKSESERLDKLIEARLIKNEPWEVATGRGFDD